LPLLAEEPPPGDDKDTLMALLDEQTAIATRTRMNADYVPGMVTVLHGDDLEARGFRTVWEALALVPGMETAMEKTGRRRVLVRGLGNTWASGNVKILLNDVSMNSAELGLAEPVFNIPIEQVERIEVIRGPGSAIYGEYAYMGVINVITHSEQSRVFAFGGSFDTKGAGGVLNFSAPEDPVQASLNIAGWRSSGADVKTGEDHLYPYDPYFPEGAGNVSNAPGPANEEVDAATAVFKLAHERFSFLAQWTQDGLGDHFGASFYLPPDPNRIVERTRHRSVDMRQEIPFTPSLTAGVQLSWKDIQRTRDNLFVFPESSVTPEMTLDSEHLETTTTLGTDFTYRGWALHNLLIAASIGRASVDRNWTAVTPSDPVPPMLLEGMSRQLSAITLQDEYRRSDLFTLTTGVRYDEYSDAGIHYSPRVAGVWRIDEKHIVKAQYAEAFRPPTLLEIVAADYYGEEHQPAATISTSELGYIVKGATSETKLTAFRSRLNDLAVFLLGTAGSGSFATQSATAWGTELEQSWRPSYNWGFDGNVSYVDTRDEKTGAPFPGSAKWLANVSTSYSSGTFSTALQAHHVSNYFREPQDTRATLAGYTIVNLTCTFARILGSEGQLRVGVKNIFDTEVRYPAPLNAAYVDPHDPDAVTLLPTYPNDFPREGRTWWAQMSYRF
jgi:iron complex outermembrane receptor protein